VKNHVQAILEKLNAVGRTQAVALAAQRGLVDIG
jgi:DNA-binding CsgD family transcriptional regulator